MISIVDDDESVRVSTRTLLTSAGYYDAHTFASAYDFLKSEAVKSTDCLILDVRMPGIDGLKLQQHLCQQGFRIPTIFITASDDEFLRRRLIACGAVDVLQKPFEASSFLTAVESALWQPSSAHINCKRIQEVARRFFERAAYMEPTSLLSRAESEHFPTCSVCLETLAGALQNIIGDRDSTNALEQQSVR